ncbi:MAG TPA: isoprenyl transferase [Bacteroidetes bacterium]|nr:isoprenyl transferase [Bacteroidota bacterium]
MSIINQLDKEKIPKHIAIIMDGNGRWAKSKGMPRVFGHREGVKTVREITESAAKIGVKYLTLYAFSTENWKRPAYEVNALMSLLVNTIDAELQTLMKNDIKLEAIGDIKSLPNKSYKSLLKGMDKTAKNTRMTLVLALNYSGRWDITNAINLMLNNDEITQINEEKVKSFLSTAAYPDPELVIRTSGEIRLSNFLLWESAYSELYFCDVFWPDFKEEYFYKAIYDFQNRERRFGKISEQINKK